MTRAHKQTNKHTIDIYRGRLLPGEEIRVLVLDFPVAVGGRVARRVAGVMPWVSWVALLSRIAGIAGVAPAIRGSWRALQHIQ